jgi:PDZ domain-containing protein/aspartyl protease
MNRARCLTSVVLGFLMTLAAAPRIDAQQAAAAPSATRARAFTVPFESANLNVFVPVTIGPKRFWFLLDTGLKSALIDLDIARSLQLEMGDSVAVGGGGKDRVWGRFLKNSPFGIAGLSGFSQPLFLALPLGDLSKASGREIAGILGYDFIRQFVVSIDYTGRTITLQDTTGYHYEGKGESFPITFNASSHPLVKARVIDRYPIDGTFVFDIGSGAGVILNTPLVEERHLLSGRRTIPWLQGKGLGGSIAGSVGRMKELELGRFRIHDPVVVFSQAASGPFAAPEVQGNIGAAVLDKFTIILDYCRSRIILEPNATFSKPQEYNRSGLSMTSTGDDYRTYRIDDVAEGSPGSDAGLKPGDIMTGINGRPAADYSLSDIRMMFQDAKRCDVTVLRGEKRLQVRLALRRVI